MSKPEVNIGIFDSGTGGLTVARAIREVVPEYSLIYLDDNAYMPYGGKSAAAIQHYAAHITQWLVAQECSMIVIACHSVSCIAEAVVRQYATTKTVMNVVDPMLHHLQQHYKDARVVLMGTRHTIGSNVYPARLAQLAPNLELIPVATPVLATMVEEGFTDGSSVRLALDRYFGHIDWSTVDALVLGCTHYPLLLPSLRKVLGQSIDILDPALFLAEQVKRWGQDLELPRELQKPMADRFYLTDVAEYFISVAQNFFQKSICIDPQEFETAFRNWVFSFYKIEGGKTIAIDGKRVRGSYGPGKAAIHMVGAFATEADLALAQVKTEDKSNEITAIPELLDALILKGCIVTLDAMGCQKAIVEKIKNKGGDYVISLKGNQGALHDDVRLFLTSKTRPMNFMKLLKKGMVELRLIATG